MLIPCDYIACGDNVELMRGLPDECIDLTVTSPPYDNLRNYKGYSFDFEACANELLRITKVGGVIVWVVSDATVKGSETGTSFKQALYFKQIGFNIHDTMIWVKNGGGSVGSNLCYCQNTEYMFVFSKGKPKAVNLIRDHKNVLEGAVRVGHGRRRPDGSINHENWKERVVPAYSKRNNWWFIPRTKCYGNHPAAFPESLARDHIISWSNPGDIVLDPFIGSGTTAKMAMLNGRHYIGFDISQEYVDIANKRLAECKPSQLSLMI